MADPFETRAPGVYIEEIIPVGPITGAGTSTAALIGVATGTVATADLGVPVMITSWTQYVDAFGGFKTGNPLAYATYGFFQNGGTVVQIIPVKDIKDGATLDAALDKLSRIHDINLVGVPGLVDPTAQTKVVTHCQAMGNRFAILDGVQDDKPLDAAGVLQTQKSGLLSEGGWGALYWPWIVVDDPATTDTDKVRTTSVPPSGHIAGIMARSDATVGVHKAPANEQVRGARSLDYLLNDVEQGQLNHLNINAIRLFPGSPPLLWGARTITDGVPWRYVNVRRLLAYIEDSIRQSIRWAVIEPNTTGLWKSLERTIGEFLMRVWQDGALFGRTAKDAFYVTINEELNPPSVRATGKLIVEIGVAAATPLEFIIIRIGLWDGGSQTTES